MRRFLSIFAVQNWPQSFPQQKLHRAAVAIRGECAFREARLYFKLLDRLGWARQVEWTPGSRRCSNQAAGPG
jgi:hypothetical protein